MQHPRYAQLNPGAFALAAGCVALVGTLVMAFPTVGMMSYMGPYYGHMWGGAAWPFFGIVGWIGSAICAAIAGAIFAWIYNAANASRTASSSDQPPPTSVRSAP